MIYRGVSRMLILFDSFLGLRRVLHDIRMLYDA